MTDPHTQDRRFSLITLVGDSRSDETFLRHTFRMYGGFDSFFRLMDIREYKAAENYADVTILDRFAMSSVMTYEGFRHEDMVDRLAGTRNLVFMTSDLHYWSIFPGTIDRRLIEPRIPVRLPAFVGDRLVRTGFFSPPPLSPEDNRNELMFEMFDRLGIHHLITNYHCPELKAIESERPDLHTYVIDLHIDPHVFRDYGSPKTYDVIIYGSLFPLAYPFRARVCRLLIEARDLNVLHIKPPAPSYDIEKCGKGLARKINQAWLGLATTSTFDYLVGKYFEIPACKTVVLGNMNAQGKAIFDDNYIHIDDHMSDREILSIVRAALENKDRLRKYADRMYRVMHENYTLKHNERKLFDIAAHIADES